jgi:hypothetical protein
MNGEEVKIWNQMVVTYLNIATWKLPEEARFKLKNSSVCSAASWCVILLLVDNTFTFTHFCTKYATNHTTIKLLPI